MVRRLQGELYAKNKEENGGGGGGLSENSFPRPSLDSLKTVGNEQLKGCPSSPFNRKNNRERDSPPSPKFDWTERGEWTPPHPQCREYSSSIIATQSTNSEFNYEHVHTVTTCLIMIESIFIYILYDPHRLVGGANYRAAMIPTGVTIHQWRTKFQH